MKNFVISIATLIFGAVPIWGEEILNPLLETKTNSEYRVLPYAQCLIVVPGFGLAIRKQNIQYDANVVFFRYPYGQYVSQTSISRIYFPKGRGFNYEAGFGAVCFGGFTSKGVLPGIEIPLFIGYESSKAFVSFDVALTISAISLIVPAPPIIPLPVLKAGFSF